MPRRERRTMQHQDTTALSQTGSVSTTPQLSRRIVSLPLDVILLVLDAVKELRTSRYARKTLCSCARTCRAMVRPSQVRLYADVAISGGKVIEGFGRTITSNKDLASMVKELSAHIRSVRPAPWVLPNEVPLSPQAIRGMANLRKLSIRGVAPTGSTTLQSSAALKDFILSFAFYCPTIKDLRLARLEFQCYYDLVMYVTAFRAVETLDFKSVTWSGGGPIPALDDGGSTYCAPELRTLKITLYRQDLPTWDFTVGSWGSSIQSLTIHIANQTREFRGLSTFSQLRHFELRMADDDIRTAPAALLHIKSEHIKTVRIVHEAQMRDMRGWLPTLYEWLCFDEILSEPPYTSLTRVTWCLLSNEPDAEGWFLDLPRRFSRLAERGILVCER